MLLRATITLAGPLALLAGCGDSRTPVPNLTRPAAPRALRTLGYPAAGIVLRAPASWSVVSHRVPLVATISSGAAIVAVWRFPGGSRPPSTPAALRRAMIVLIAAARRRDPGLRLIRVSAHPIRRVPAIELDAVERIRGQIRRVRSTHLFTSRAEIVLDEYAPLGMFGHVDRSVFSPLKRSLRLISGAATG